MDATGARGYNHLTGHKRKIPDIAVSIWNLSKGEIFFSGRVVLYQKWVKEAWDGKYKLDSLDSLISQFTEQGKGKRYDERDRYALWPCYKTECRTDDIFIEKMLADIPANFSPQKDAPDFYEFLQGKSFTIKNNCIKVFTNTAIINNDFASILKAAKTIVSSLFAEDSPASLILIKNTICYDSIDVSDVEMGDSPIQDVELTKFETGSKIFSFIIHFDLEFCSKWSIDKSEKKLCSAGAHKIYSLDFLLLYFEHVCYHPENTFLDKKNHLYFRSPKNSHEESLIYSSRIIGDLAQSTRPEKKEDKLFFWMVRHADKTRKEQEKEKYQFIHSYEQNSAVSDYIKEYGENGKVSKKNLMKHLKDAIDISPLDFIDDKNFFIASYAKTIISGESV
ncbi:MAG: hypothetical protein MJY93_05615 [Fibrobacter sp.]|nr:hypothetical protein [Fibrobacter sp.]